MSDTSPKLVTASKLAAILKDFNIPLVVLNACSSATVRVSNQEGNLAFTLVKDGGVDYVVAMAYKAKADTAALFVRSFYEFLLLRNFNVEESVTLARTALREQAYRDARYSEKVVCYDWHSIVLYRKRPSSVPRVFENPDDLGLMSLSIGLDTDSHVQQEGLELSLISSEADLLGLEMALSVSPIAIFQGPPGSGKSFIIKRICDWWTETDFAECNYLDMTYDCHFSAFAREAKSIMKASKIRISRDNSPQIYVFDGLDPVFVDDDSRAKSFDTIKWLFDSVDTENHNLPLRFIFVTSLPPKILRRELPLIPIHEKTPLSPQEGALQLDKLTGQSNAKLADPRFRASVQDLIEDMAFNWYSVQTLCVMMGGNDEEIESLNVIAPSCMEITNYPLNREFIGYQSDGPKAFKQYMRSDSVKASPEFFIILSLCSFSKYFPLQHRSMWLYQLIIFPYSDFVRSCGLSDLCIQEDSYDRFIPPRENWMDFLEFGNIKDLNAHWDKAVSSLCILGAGSSPASTSHDPRATTRALWKIKC